MKIEIIKQNDKLMYRASKYIQRDVNHRIKHIEVFHIDETIKRAVNGLNRLIK